MDFRTIGRTSDVSSSTAAAAAAASASAALLHLYQPSSAAAAAAAMGTPQSPHFGNHLLHHSSGGVMMTSPTPSAPPPLHHHPMLHGGLWGYPYPTTHAGLTSLSTSSSSKLTAATPPPPSAAAMVNGNGHHHHLVHQGLTHSSTTSSSNNNNSSNGKCSSSSSSSSSGAGGRTPAPYHHGPLALSDGAGDPMRSPVRSASVAAAAYLGQVQVNNDVNSRVTPSPSNNSNNNSTTNTRSPHRQHQQRSSSSSSKKESSHKSSNRWARPGAADGDSSLTVSSASSTGHATTVTSRSRSPPVVTIAPTLSLSNLSHYQDSRKAFDRAMLCHTVPSLPSSGGVFSSSGIPGGLSTGLAGLSSLTNGGGPNHPYTTSSLVASSSSSNASLTTNSGVSDYLSSAFPSIPPFGVYSAAAHAQQQQQPPQAPTPRPDDLFYGGLRSSMQQTAAAAAAAASSNSIFRPEDSNNSLGGMLPPRNLPMSLASSYHESLLSQLPSSSRPSSSSSLLAQQEEYLLATARSSGAYNPYGLSSLEHSNIHPSLYSNPFAFRSLEEQLYLERYGLLRPGSTASAMSSPFQTSQGQGPPSLSFPSYLNFRYPSPLLHPTASDLAGLSAISNGAIDSAALNRMKLEEEQRIKERIREEELAAIANKFQNDRPASSIGRPLATVTPSRENVNSQQQRRDRDRQRDKDKKKSERDRPTTVQLPNESTTAVRGVKVNTVNPLCASYGLPTADPPVSRHYTGDLLLLPPTPLPPPVINSISINESLNSSLLSSNSQNGDLVKRSGGLCNVSAEFSLGALEAMAVLKQQQTHDHSPVRIVSTVYPQLDTEAHKKSTKSEDEPMDLSDSAVTQTSAPCELTDINRLIESTSCNGSITHEMSNSELLTATTEQPSLKNKTADPNEGVRSLLDVRVERWKRKRGSEPGDDEDVDDDVLDQEVCASGGFSNGASESNYLTSSFASSTSPGSTHCSKGCTIPAGVSEKQHNFLHMFGLVTPQKRSDVELVKCIRRQKILREPTPPPIESEDEDSATLLLKQRTRLAATQVQERSDSESKVAEAADPALCDFAVRLNLFPTDKQIIENVEKSWSIVVADRMRRHFGQHRETVRKRLWSDTFRPLNFDQTPPNTDGQLNQVASEEPDVKKEAICDPVIHKPVPQPNSGLFIPHQLPVPPQAVANNQPPSSEVLPISVANLAKLELTSVTPAVNEENKIPLSSIGSNGKLTSEVAFWLRHLKPTMARTLTSNKETVAFNGTNDSNMNRSMSDDQSSSSPDSPNTEGPVTSSSTNEPSTLARWPGTDSIMVLYMAHQQELSLETKFLREHCERLHVQLAEGQATLSKLCLALSSSVETQRRCKEEDAFTLQTINDLQMTLKLLQSSR